jgi:peptidyl-tRNA hydrolase
MPFLYILMRTDLESMNPGKAVAQGAHAANQFTHEADMVKSGVKMGHTHTNSEQLILSMYEYWRTRTGDGFGTTICLGVNEDQLKRIVDAGRRAGMLASVTHDPSYPLRDGDVTHFFPLDTCGFIFGDKDELKILLGQFNLMP